MPELPEVETICRGISPHIEGHSIAQTVIRNHNLRYPIDQNLANHVEKQKIIKIWRRSKYIILSLETGTIIIHLGMSGTLRIVDKDLPPNKHDHFDLIFENLILRYQDHRRFGCLIYTNNNPLEHKLLATLGPEPLTDQFNGEYLFNISRKRTKAVKVFIMDNHIVVGAGNIYANEALFASGIDPRKAAGTINRKQYDKLAKNIKIILEKAIAAGGTTISDYRNSEGKPGYFQQELLVYGKDGENCQKCNNKITSIKLGQRSTFYCPQCQK
ncbi:MAG: bifunctional DNA-formamidopyrimidine glycosylase/DNA-(apurinic or apyrimidinic site) lyase [Gammaproteobacteria bacterium]|nr:MAG: bifunctional DNA-formamidopyrimidine glycosylase/DNA-(apurinic or apyrimidinic site) lyase [Gammaproteobacteria bacterium]